MSIENLSAASSSKDHSVLAQSYHRKAVISVVAAAAISALGAL